MTTTRKRLPDPLLLTAVACLLLAGVFAAGARATVPGDNGRIAFVSSKDGDDEIYTANPDGSGVVPLTSNAVTDVGPAWSPDGGRIAFVSNRDGDYEIYVMAADGSGQTRLTFAAGIDTDPRWSPDGKRIAFTSFRDKSGEGGEIYVMDADGSNPTRLTNNTGPDDSAAWSPDGQRIAFSSNRAPYGPDGEIFVMGADGSNPIALTDNSAADGTPAWSPDGQRIAFSTNRGGGILDFRIYVMGPDGSDQTEVATGAGYSGVPAWSPDGRRIAFVGLRPDGQKVLVAAADGSGEAALTTGPIAWHESSPDWQALPHVDLPASSSPAEAGDTVAPRISGFRAAPRRFRYTLSEPARVTLTIQRALRGRSGRYRELAVLSRAGRAGANRGTFRRRLAQRLQRPGRYRVLIAAADSAGNRASPRAARFRARSRS